MSKFFKILMLGACSVLFVPWQCTSDEFHQQKIENLSSDSQSFKISEVKQYYSKLIYQNQPNGSFQKNRTSNILLNIDWSKEIPNFGSFKKAHSLGLNTHLIGNYNLVSKLLFVKSPSAQIGVKLISWYSFDDKINWNSFNGYVFITDIFGEIEEVYRIEEGLTRKKITPIIGKNISELNFIKNENQTRNKEACAINPDILCELGGVTITLTTSKPQFPVEFIFPPDELGGGDDVGGTESGDVDVDEGGGSSSGNSTNPDNNEDPCDKASRILNDANVKDNITDLRTKLNELRSQGEKGEYGTTQFASGEFSDPIYEPCDASGHCSVSPPAPGCGGLSTWHTHPYNYPFKYFSAGDIGTFLLSLLSFNTTICGLPAHANRFSFGLITNNYTYILTYGGYLPSLGLTNANIWNAIEEIGAKETTYYAKALADPIQATKLMLADFQELLNLEGLELTTVDEDFNPTNHDINSNNVNQTPCE